MERGPVDVGRAEAFGLVVPRELEDRAWRGGGEPGRRGGRRLEGRHEASEVVGVRFGEDGGDRQRTEDMAVADTPAFDLGPRRGSEQREAEDGEDTEGETAFGAALPPAAAAGSRTGLNGEAAHLDHWAKR